MYPGFLNLLDFFFLMFMQLCDSITVRSLFDQTLSLAKNEQIVPFTTPLARKPMLMDLGCSSFCLP